MSCLNSPSRYIKIAVDLREKGSMGGGGVWPMVVLDDLLSFVVAAAVPAVGNGWQLTQLDRIMQLMRMNRIEKKYN